MSDAKRTLTALALLGSGALLATPKQTQSQSNAPAGRGEVASEVEQDAARYRFLRRKIAFVGVGDGTATMHVLNLPLSPRFPDVGEHEKLADEAIDEAIKEQA